MSAAESTSESIPDAAAPVFGPGLDGAVSFIELLRAEGVMRGVIGPRELDRLWDRHLLNSAVLAEQIPDRSRVVDVGSGGGFPGVPLALARPDIAITLLEPMARRIEWLREAVERLGLVNVDVVRGRAEERPIRDSLAGADVVTARAVAPLAKLAGWCLPLVRTGGVLLALKGASAEEEIVRDAAAVRSAGGDKPSILRCGVGVIESPITVVSVAKRDHGAGVRTRGKRK
ncbi:MAG: 16S rRNA (guanine(527)-N(7))-methyltransferase RsmG [Actinophytocola sp.]|nr:16S rRNA (guanine(527)-N(7))-methyltransferase RsmG [Actinophytocola sp.]